MTFIVEDEGWAKLTKHARALLAMLAGPNKNGTTKRGDGRLAYVLRRHDGATELEPHTAAAIVELETLGLIESMSIPKEKLPGYALTPSGVGMMMFSAPESPEDAAETKRVGDFLNRHVRGE